jgi:hypothetical protein
VASPGVRSEISESKEKIDGSDITMLERYVLTKVRYLYCLMKVYIYIYGAAYSNPSLSSMCRCGRSDHYRGSLMGRVRPQSILDDIYYICSFLIITC